jgi:putative membrane protein
MLTTSTGRIRADFGANRLLQALVVAYAVWWVFFAVAPKDRFDWVLENLLVFIFVPVLTLTYRRFPLSDLSYVLITLFLALHAVGAHYTYSEVPLGDWARDAFSLTRNHFDRVVHWSFGLLLAYPVREVFLRIARTRGFFAYWLPLDVTLAFSALYEIVEWAVAATVDPAAGDAYLGTQGDVWDAQKDMALAGLGALLAMCTTAGVRTLRERRRRAKRSRAGPAA